jgi:hypothetical protein
MTGSHSRAAAALRATPALMAAAALGCTAPAAPASDAPATAPPERVRVYYAPGTCVGLLEIELFDRASQTWRPHPEHPRLPPGACASESPETLLNELRVRCVDPTGRWAPSDWVVGAELGKGESGCPQ